MLTYGWVHAYRQTFSALEVWIMMAVMAFNRSSIVVQGLKAHEPPEHSDGKG